jgi:adenylate kinase
MRLILLGAPGSGKGTQAALLAEELAIPAISTGEMLRQAVAAGTPLGERIEKVMSSGDLVDDATMGEVVKTRLAREDAEGGFILDGYPRTLAQADQLAEILVGMDAEQDGVLYLQVPEAELVKRILGRQRADDKEDVIRQRLLVYRRQTQPLVEYYEQRGLLMPIDGDRPEDEVAAALLEALGRKVDA